MDSDPLEQVDRRCHCERCKQSGRNGFYRLLIRCGNCGLKHVGKYRKGDKFSSLSECPHCGVSYQLTSEGWYDGAEPVGEAGEA